MTLGFNVYKHLLNLLRADIYLLGLNNSLKVSNVC